MAAADPVHDPPLRSSITDVSASVRALMRDLRSTPDGLASQDARDRLRMHGRNIITRVERRQWPRRCGRQIFHPLALLLWAACLLAVVADMYPISIAVITVIFVNAGFALIQEQQAERAVEALAIFLPHEARVLRDGQLTSCDVATLVPGDVIELSEGDRVPADARMISGQLKVDMSALTGESEPVDRHTTRRSTHAPLLEARDVIFSGTTCIGGSARAVVFATGMTTQIGRIAALSQRVEQIPSPLERQVRHIAWIIAIVAVISGAAFIPLAMTTTGLAPRDALVLAIGLIVGNVPEGLLPVITLALAGGVRHLARHGSIVKRLSAVETLGATDVICTDKTGTLTCNRMQATWVWIAQHGMIEQHEPSAHTHALACALLACSTVSYDADGSLHGDPTEVALVELGRLLMPVDAPTPQRHQIFPFDPNLRLMTTVDAVADTLIAHTKGAPEDVMERCTMSTNARQDARARVTEAAHRGLRVIAIATRTIDEDSAPRNVVEQQLTLVALIGLHDPPRTEVPTAVDRCHRAGIRIIMVTGDHPDTAAAIARQIGITRGTPRIITERELDHMNDRELYTVLEHAGSVLFARTAPEAKLRIARALETMHHVVAMTGDGVNDAPALRQADIGIAMGRSGTDVAREAATMILTDDNFATIVQAIHLGRVTYANIRKFIFYIFAHLTPEIVPFCVFALSGGNIPLPLTILQLLAFEIGTETLPALALGREPPEPGVMEATPRSPNERLVEPSMLVRSWLFLGVIAAALQMASYMHVLLRNGWVWGADVSNSSYLHHAYEQATTITFLSMVAAQIGTAIAARSTTASLRSIGVFSNPLLIWGILFEVGIATLLVMIPPMQHVLGMAIPDTIDLLLLAPIPVIVWGADEVRKLIVRARR